MARCKQCGKFSLFGFNKYQHGMCEKCYRTHMNELSAFSEMKRHIQSEYVNLDNKFRSYRITTMTKREFESFYFVGIKLLELLPQYVPMIRRDEELHDDDALYFYENIPIKLLDYCCRFGEIEKGNRVISFIDKPSIFRQEFFVEQANLFFQREQAVRCAKDYLSRNGETAKAVMITEMPYVEKEPLQWAMRFYKGFSARKDGSKYIVSLCDIK